MCNSDCEAEVDLNFLTDWSVRAGVSPAVTASHPLVYGSHPATRQRQNPDFCQTAVKRTFHFRPVLPTAPDFQVRGAHVPRRQQSRPRGRQRPTAAGGGGIRTSLSPFLGGGVQTVMTLIPR